MPNTQLKKPVFFAGLERIDDLLEDDFA